MVIRAARKSSFFKAPFKMNMATIRRGAISVTRREPLTVRLRPKAA